MTSTFSIKNPDAVECEMRITLSLQDWKALKDQIGTTQSGYLAWALCDSISELVAHATKQFETEKTSE